MPSLFGREASYAEREESMRSSDIIRWGGMFGPNGRVGALRGCHLAGDGAAALVWVGTHRGAADSVLPK